MHFLVDFASFWFHFSASKTPWMTNFFEIRNHQAINLVWKQRMQPADLQKDRRDHSVWGAARPRRLSILGLALTITHLSGMGTAFEYFSIFLSNSTASSLRRTTQPYHPDNLSPKSIILFAKIMSDHALPAIYSYPPIQGRCRSFFRLRLSFSLIFKNHP